MSHNLYLIPYLKEKQREIINLVDLKYDTVFEELFRIDEEFIWLIHEIKPQMLLKSSKLGSV